MDRHALANVHSNMGEAPSAVGIVKNVSRLDLRVGDFSSEFQEILGRELAVTAVVLPAGHTLGICGSAALVGLPNHVQNSGDSRVAAVVVARAGRAGRRGRTYIQGARFLSLFVHQLPISVSLGNEERVFRGCRNNRNLALSLHAKLIDRGNGGLPWGDEVNRAILIGRNDILVAGCESEVESAVGGLRLEVAHTQPGGGSSLALQSVVI